MTWQLNGLCSKRLKCDLMVFLHKAITSLADLGRWRGSTTFDELQRFISALCDKVAEPPTETPDVIATLNACIFECLDQCVDEVPAGAHIGRFANPVYREFVMLAEKVGAPRSTDAEDCGEPCGPTKRNEVTCARRTSRVHHRVSWGPETYGLWYRT